MTRGASAWHLVKSSDRLPTLLPKEEKKRHEKRFKVPSLQVATAKLNTLLVAFFT
jgi:hypothetical protein